MIDSLRAQGELTPVPMPAARNGGSIRTPLFDLRDLDRVIEKWKQQKGAEP